MGVNDIFMFVADAIYDYALAVENVSDDDEEEDEDDDLDMSTEVPSDFHSAFDDSKKLKKGN